MRPFLISLGFIGFLLVPLRSTVRGDVQPGEKYRPLVESLKPWIEKEVTIKKLPALSIVLVDDQEIVWSHGFGFADPADRMPATSRTLYRMGSVSKPFTVLVLMMLVEMGLIDLDLPIQRYLPDFHPENPYKKPITLRQMVSHRSGLVRESPVGNYFDDSGASLEATVKSINKTKLVYEPETTTSYSNAALTTVGYVLERTTKEPFARLMQRRLLGPLGMADSTFDLQGKARKNLARALMWSYHGRQFPAPTWEMAMAPAGSLYSSADDMGRFLRFLLAGGKGPNGQLLKAETLEKMWQIQLDNKKEAKAGFGLGFYVSEFEGKRRIGHGGAVYGFATDLSVLPDDKIGVAVMASRDVANAVTRHIADAALRHLLALRQGKPLPKLEETRPVDPGQARKLAGRYQGQKKGFDLIESEGKLFLLPFHGGSKVELRMLGSDLIGDDLLAFGQKVAITKDGLKIGKDLYKRVKPPAPGSLPDKWRGLIGEYGPDYNVLVILERDGKLNALIEWFFLYPLKEITPDVYQFPEYGLYQGDRLVFKRDQSGRAVMAEAANVPFRRRVIHGETGTFTLQPVRSLEELRRQALSARPPVEKNPLFRKPDLVDVTRLDPAIKLDIRYAGTNNFLGAPFYQSARAFLQRPAALALVKVHQKLKDQGYGLLIHDAYRPWYVTKMFWDATPEKYHLFVADPTQGSRHNRGCAVDLTLYDLKTGQAVDMVSGYDEFSDRAFADYLGGTSSQRFHRDLLRQTMEEMGFTVYQAEWWHFDFHQWREYPLMNVKFEEVK